MQNQLRIFSGDELLKGFEELWSTLDTFSKLPDCFVDGNFPPTNILMDEEGNYTIQMAVAGYPEDKIASSFKDDYLTVSLTPDEDFFKGYQVKMHGFRNTKASRKVYVPSKDFEVAKADATTKNGVLTIKIPRKPEAKPFNINIKPE